MPEIPQTILLARQMYVERKTVREIQAATGLSLDRVYYGLDGLPQPDASTLLPPIPRRRIVARRLSRAATRIALVTRLMRATEMHVHDVEKRFARNKSNPASRESDARRLAVLAKTMRELIALDKQNSADDGAGKSAQPDDDFIPRDVDELRRELARRVDLLRQRRAADGTAGEL
jgi:hypothetical protein